VRHSLPPTGREATGREATGREATGREATGRGPDSGSDAGEPPVKKSK